jgi:hypothetical protein
MMEAVNTFETPVNFYQITRRNIPKYSHLHTRRHENLKSHDGYCFHLDGFSDVSFGVSLVICVLYFHGWILLFHVVFLKMQLFLFLR